MKIRILLLLFLVCFGFIGHAKTNPDSLQRCAENTSLSDSLRVNACISLSLYYKDSDMPKSLELGEQALTLANSNGSARMIARAKDHLATILKVKGEYKRAEELYLDAAETFVAVNDTVNVALVYGHLGAYYQAVEQNQLAILYLLRSLKMDLARGENGQSNVAATLNNIGNVYYSDSNFEQALEYYRNALRMNKIAGNRKYEAINYLNMGNALRDMKQIDSAYWYYNESIRIAEELKIIWVVAGSREGTGQCLLKKDKSEEAKREFMLGLEAAYAYGNKELCYYLEGGLAEAYMELGQLDSARAKWQMCFDSASYYHFSFLLSQVYLVGGKIYEASGDYLKANALYKRYVDLRDSLAFEQNAMVYRNFEERLRQEERDHEEELKQQGEQEQAEAENRRNKIILIFTVVVLLLAVALGLFAYRSYRLKKKSHENLAHQKDIIEEKNREILSSITYAQRLQSAILPSEKLWKQHFADSFLFYRPKDIVAGDFYWLETENNRVLFAVADCTGHGVPGALVSVVCSNALNRAVHEFGLTTPGAILDKVTELVTFTFENSGQDVYDGMDISIGNYNPAQRTLEWAGANLPLWIYRNSSATLEEIKPDKQPVGKFDLRKPFTTHTVALNTGDMLFLFSDGYADQFGGPKGKKFKYKPMQELLRSNAHESIAMQSEKLTSAFDEWRGALEQVDDVCVIGIRI